MIGDRLKLRSFLTYREDLGYELDAELIHHRKKESAITANLGIASYYQFSITVKFPLSEADVFSDVHRHNVDAAKRSIGCRSATFIRIRPDWNYCT